MTYVEPTSARAVNHGRWLAGCTGILLLGAAMRLIALAGVPPGLAQDEVLNADIVSFIRGGKHAFFFRYGYGHEPLYHYWSVPFQVLLGDNFLSIRLPAVFLGILLIALTLRWARRDFGSVTGLIAGFGLAVSWWPIIFSRIGLRPIMEPVILVCAVLVWPRLQLPLTRDSIVRAVIAGGLLGLTLYTYTAARVLFALPLAYGLYCGLSGWLATRKHRVVGTTASGPGGSNWASSDTYRQQALYSLIALATMIVVALPLFFTLRADPTLQQRVDQLSGPLDALKQGEIRPIVATSMATLGYFGVTGDPRWTYSLPDRPLFEPLAAVLFLSGLGFAIWRWRNPRYAFILIWLAVAIVPSMVTPDAPSSVRLVGAMPVVYVFPGLAVAGLMHWTKRPRAQQPALNAFLVIGLVGIAVLAIGRSVQRWLREMARRSGHTP